ARWRLRALGGRTTWRSHLVVPMKSKAQWRDLRALVAIAGALSALLGACRGESTAACAAQAVGSACLSCERDTCGVDVGSQESDCSGYFSCLCAGGSFSCSRYTSNACGQQTLSGACGLDNEEWVRCATTQCRSECNYDPCPTDGG